VLGGLLSAYHLTGEDPIYLEKAIELADRMIPVFNTPSGLPLTNVNLALREGRNDPHWPEFVSSAEVATLQLELRYLSVVSGNSIYWEKAESVRFTIYILVFANFVVKVMHILKSVLMPHGLASIFLKSGFVLVRGFHKLTHSSWQTGEFVLSAMRLGSRADSYYEYLLYVYPFCFISSQYAHSCVGSNTFKLSVCFLIPFGYRLTTRTQLESNRNLL
jgi:mannosyl-oligosaccharide alpha-1,2-mannosidase